MKIEDGGPAFGHGNPEHGGDPGMSLRDWFAGQALANSQIAQELGSGELRRLFEADKKVITKEEIYSARAYAIADAMLAARHPNSGEQDG